MLSSLNHILLTHSLPKLNTDFLDCLPLVQRDISPFSQMNSQTVFSIQLPTHTYQICLYYDNKQSVKPIQQNTHIYILGYVNTLTEAKGLNVHQQNNQQNLTSQTSTMFNQNQTQSKQTSEIDYSQTSFSSKKLY